MYWSISIFFLWICCFECAVFLLIFVFKFSSSISFVVLISLRLIYFRNFTTFNCCWWGSFPNRRVAEILFLLLQWQHSVEFRFCCDDKRKEKEKEKKDHVKNWMWRLPFYGTLLFNHWLWLGLTWIEIDKSLVGCNQMCPMCLYIEIDIWTSACPSNFNRMLRFSNWLNTIAFLYHGNFRFSTTS